MSDFHLPSALIGLVFGIFVVTVTLFGAIITGLVKADFNNGEDE